MLLAYRLRQSGVAVDFVGKYESPIQVGLYQASRNVI